MRALLCNGMGFLLSRTVCREIFTMAEGRDIHEVLRLPGLGILAFGLKLPRMILKTIKP